MPPSNVDTNANRFSTVNTFNAAPSCAAPSASDQQQNEITHDILQRVAKRTLGATSLRIGKTVKYDAGVPPPVESQLYKNLQKARCAKADQQRSRRAISDSAVLGGCNADPVVADPIKFLILIKFGVFRKGSEKAALEVRTLVFIITCTLNPIRVAQAITTPTWFIYFGGRCSNLYNEPRSCCRE